MGAHLTKFALSFKYFLIFIFFDLHLTQLFVEELSLVKVFLLLSNQFSLLEVSCNIFLSFHVDFLKHLFFSLTFLLTFIFELNHLIISPFKLQRLLLLTLFFGRLESFIESFLLSVLGLDFVSQISNL